MTVEVLYLADCPNHSAAIELVRGVLEEEGSSAEFTETQISDYCEAERHGFLGSPTLRVNGRDVEAFPLERIAVGLSCRTYWVGGKPQGVPPREWVQHAIREAQTREENRR